MEGFRHQKPVEDQSDARAINQLIGALPNALNFEGAGLALDEIAEHLATSPDLIGSTRAQIKAACSDDPELARSLDAKLGWKIVEHFAKA